jgi:omega-6 fatty acid desaturase (delta-12 desaturase)
LLPRVNPPFTVGELKRAVPARCFQPTLVESFSHLFKDLAEISLYLAVMTYLDQPLWDFSPVLWAGAWLLYTWMQGVVFTGVWVIAHECGHGAFSTSNTINDTVGFILHTCLSVPYFAWQHTHANHHHFTNNLQKDEVFVPRKQSEIELTSAYKKLPKNPIVNFIQLVFMLLFGWPLYLLINTSGHRADVFTSHFLPSSPIFTKKERVKVILSDVGLIVWWFILYLIGQEIGSGFLFRLYVLPLLVNNAFLVAITYMQHTHADVPHYDSAEWTWLRGALCTVDRTMGSYLDGKLHLIHVTHVLHHIFPNVPFYRSKEASAAIVKVIGRYHTKDDSNFLMSMWDNSKNCTFLEEGDGILYWMRENH